MCDGIIWETQWEKGKGKKRRGRRKIAREHLRFAVKWRGSGSFGLAPVQSIEVLSPLGWKAGWLPPQVLSWGVSQSFRLWIFMWRGSQLLAHTLFSWRLG